MFQMEFDQYGIFPAVFSILMILLPAFTVINFYRNKDQTILTGIMTGTFTVISVSVILGIIEHMRVLATYENGTTGSLSQTDIRTGLIITMAAAVMYGIRYRKPKGIIVAAVTAAEGFLAVDYLALYIYMMMNLISQTAKSVRDIIGIIVSAAIAVLSTGLAILWSETKKKRISKICVTGSEKKQSV